MPGIQDANKSGENNNTAGDKFILRLIKMRPQRHYSIDDFYMYLGVVFRKKMKNSK